MAYLHRVSQKVIPCPGDHSHDDPVHAQGVTNMEMEALVFAGLTHKAGIRAAVVCVTLLDRLQGDQVDIFQNWFQKYVLGDNTKRGVDSMAGETYGNCVQVRLSTYNTATRFNPTQVDTVRAE